MQIKDAFERYERENPSGHNAIQLTSLALRRGGVNTLEQLRETEKEHPEEIAALRDIGPKRMILIQKILKFYEDEASE